MASGPVSDRQADFVPTPGKKYYMGLQSDMYMYVKCSRLYGCGLYMKKGRPGPEGHFSVIPSEQEGYNRIESARFPGSYVYESDFGWAYIYKYGPEESDEALFRITKSGEGTVTIRNKKWPHTFLDYYRGFLNDHPVGFWKRTEDTARQWRIQQVEE